MIVGHPATVGWLLWRYGSRHPAWAAGLVWLVTDRVGWAAIAQAADGPGMSPVSGGPIPGNQGVNLVGREPIPWRGPGTDSSRVRSCRPWRPRRVLGPSANQSSMSCCGHSARAVPRDLRNAGAGAGAVVEQSVRLCGLLGLRDGMRRGDVHVPGSRRNADPAAYLLTPEQWVPQRTEFCRLVDNRRSGPRAGGRYRRTARSPRPTRTSEDRRGVAAAAARPAVPTGGCRWLAGGRELGQAA